MSGIDTEDDEKVDIRGVLVDQGTFDFWSENRDRISCGRETALDGTPVLLLTVTHAFTGTISVMCLAVDDEFSEEEEPRNGVLH